MNEELQELQKEIVRLRELDEFNENMYKHSISIFKMTLGYFMNMMKTCSRVTEFYAKAHINKQSKVCDIFMIISLKNLIRNLMASMVQQLLSHVMLLMNV